MKKGFIKSLAVAGGLVLAMSGKNVEAGDIAAPYGRLTVVDAVEIEGVSYTSSTEITVEVFAVDNVSTEDQIEVYLSTTPIDTTTRIEDGNWLKYSENKTKTYTIDQSNPTTIYAVFRDAAGNTSMAYAGGNTEYTVRYYDVDNSTVFMERTGYFGMAFNVTTQAPENEGRFLTGWSTSASDLMTASYEPGEVIPASVFKGTDTVIELYPVWTTAGVYPTLSSVVKVGDYVDYPVYYDNVAPYNGYASTYDGWRVISIEDDGTVNLVSAGVPLSYYHPGQSDVAIKALVDNFLTTPFSVDDNHTYRKNGFTPYVSLKDVFTNEFTEMKADGVTPNVRSMIKEDILAITGAADLVAGEYLTAPKYGNMFHVGAHYWLASAYNSYYLWYVYYNGYVSNYYDYEFGVRPVVSLKSTVKATGTNAAGVWNIEM